MDQTQQIPIPDSPTSSDLYAPIAEWCASLYDARPSDDVTNWYYLALDKIVRHPDFDIDQLRKVLTANWFDFAEGPGAQEEIENICWSSKAVRLFLVARGEVAQQAPPTQHFRPVH